MEYKVQLILLAWVKKRKEAFYQSIFSKQINLFRIHRFLCKIERNGKFVNLDKIVIFYNTKYYEDLNMRQVVARIFKFVMILSNKSSEDL